MKGSTDNEIPYSSPPWRFFRCGRKFLKVCAALSALGVCAWFSSAAHAAGAKDKAKKPSELRADDKSMKKQLQWEDKVMGPDRKRAELDKIARAAAINEKATKEREKQAALEAAAPAPKPGSRRADARATVAPPPSAEEQALDADNSGRHEISPKLSTAAAATPPPAVKPADDKFIDKLLRDEPSKKKRPAASDRDLEGLLTGANQETRGAQSENDKIDDFIKSADQGPAMPAPRAPGTLPDWARQPEIAPAASLPVKTASRNDGVIHVVQGASPSVPTSAPVVSRAGGRKTSGKTAAGRGSAKPPAIWSDGQFADTTTMASRDRQQATASEPRKEPTARPSATSSAWSDPFADSPGSRKATRHTAPAAPVTPANAPKRGEKADPGAHPSGWKDPFTKANVDPTRSPVALRELGKGESANWDIASRHTVAHASASDSHVGGWTVLKKRSAP